MVLLAVLAYPPILPIETGNPWITNVKLVIVLGVAYPFIYGPQPSFHAELFPTSVCHTGISLGDELYGILSSGITPSGRRTPR